MRCKDCKSCYKGWFKSRPNEYVCIGVKEPFVIDDINAECTEYPEYRDDISIGSAINHFKYGVTHDIFREPVTSYAKMAIEALEKQIPKKVVCDGMDESDWVHCPCCDEILGINESVYDAFHDNNWNPVYCHKCGQSLTW